MPIAKESTHWYLSEDCDLGKKGDPFYLMTGKNGKERPPTLADLKRGLPICPSVTTIMREANAPGLNEWKQRQTILAALTLPRHDGESIDDFAARVIEDSKEQGKRAAERGTSLHAAIEEYAGKGQHSIEWQGHVDAVEEELSRNDIILCDGSTEHSFSSPLGYGGKVDWHEERYLPTAECLVLDVKSKDRIEDGKKMVWDEHPMQLGAYGRGLWGEGTKFRAFNVFVGVEDKKVVVVEHSWEDLTRGYAMFLALLNYWRLKSRV